MQKTIAMIAGWVLLVMGVIGLFPNPIFGDGALFHADMMHAVLHLILGALLLWAVYKAPMKIGLMLKSVGILYIVLAVLGFVLVSGTGSLLGLAEINGADNWLHIVVGVVLLLVGLKGGRGDMPMA